MKRAPMRKIRDAFTARAQRYVDEESAFHFNRGSHNLREISEAVNRAFGLAASFDSATVILKARLFPQRKDDDLGAIHN